MATAWQGLLVLSVLLMASVPTQACTAPPPSPSGTHFLHDVFEDGVHILTVDSGIDVGRHRATRCMSSSSFGVMPDPSPLHVDGRFAGMYLDGGPAWVFDVPGRTAYDMHEVSVLRTRDTLFVEGDGTLAVVDLANRSSQSLANIAHWTDFSLVDDGGPAVFGTWGQWDEESGRYGRHFGVVHSKGSVVEDLLVAMDLPGWFRVASASPEWILLEGGENGVDFLRAYDVAAGVWYDVQEPDMGGATPSLQGDEALFPFGDGVRATAVHLRSGLVRDATWPAASSWPTYETSVRTGAPMHHGWTTVVFGSDARAGPAGNVTPDPQAGTAQPSDDVLEIPTAWLLGGLAPLVAAWAIRRRL